MTRRTAATPRPDVTVPTPGATLVRRPLTLSVAVGVAVVAPSLLRGGYFPAIKGLFVLLAGAALAVAIGVDERTSARAARSRVTVTLGLLAVLSALSAAWTVGAPADALRSGLVIAGLAAIVVVGAALTVRRGGPGDLAVLIAVVAGISGLAGLIGVALHAEPWAQRLSGTWRAGGTFEYPPALALAQVSALPALLRWMASERAAAALPAAAGAAVAGAVIVISVSRVQTALAVAVLLAAVLWPSRTMRSSRATAMAAAGLVVVAGAAAYAAVGGPALGAEAGAAAARLALCLGVVAAAPGAWWAARSLARTGRQASWLAAPRAWWSGEPGRRTTIALVALGCLLALAAGAVAVRPAARSGAAPRGGFTHGRLEIWRASVQTAADRPLLGAGAEGYLAATAAHQRRRHPTRFAHSLPLEQGAELGVLGFLLALALYAAGGRELWRARGTLAAWLLGPAVAGFLLTNLLDWPWHYAGAGAIWAVALGGLVGANLLSRRPLA